METARQAHWNRVYETRPTAELSWYQEQPEPSWRWLRAAGLSRHQSVIDIGGGDSRLVDRLLDEGIERIAILDISSTGLARARARLGARADRVTWIHADVTSDEWTTPPVDIWHDRAVFHFLVDEQDRRRYVDRMRAALKPGGHAIIATFAADGPTRCSGLPVVRYAAPDLVTTVGHPFRCVGDAIEDHRTPGGTIQRFQWTLLTRD
jgi:SAM-dependent methyltransferase